MTYEQDFSYQLLLLVLDLVFCFAVASFWKSKGRSNAGGFWLSFFLTPVVGFVVGILLPPIQNSHDAVQHGNYSNSNGTRIDITDGPDLLDSPNLDQISAEELMKYIPDEVKRQYIPEDMRTRLAKREPIWQCRVHGRVGSARFSTTEIIRRVRAGLLPRDVEVWTEGTDQWRPASHYSAFAKMWPKDWDKPEPSSTAD